MAGAIAGAVVLLSLIILAVFVQQRRKPIGARWNRHVGVAPTHDSTAMYANPAFGVAARSSGSFGRRYCSPDEYASISDTPSYVTPVLRRGDADYMVPTTDGRYVDCDITPDPSVYAALAPEHIRYATVTDTSDDVVYESGSTSHGEAVDSDGVYDNVSDLTCLGVNVSPRESSSRGASQA